MKESAHHSYIRKELFTEDEKKISLYLVLCNILLEFSQGRRYNWCNWCTTAITWDERKIIFLEFFTSFPLENSSCCICWCWHYHSWGVSSGDLPVLTLAGLLSARVWGCEAGLSELLQRCIFNAELSMSTTCFSSSSAYSALANIWPSSAFVG